MTYACISRCAAFVLVPILLGGIAGCEAAAQDWPTALEAEERFEQPGVLTTSAERRAIQTRATLIAQGVLRDRSGVVLSARCTEGEDQLFDPSSPPTCDELHIESLGATYRAFLFSKARDALVIVHEGHLECVSTRRFADNVLSDARTLIERLLERADVLFLDMPMVGTNCGQKFDINGIAYTGYLHNWFGLVDEPGRSGLAYFFNHISLALDYLGPRYRTIHMTGRSGGGWATTLYAAIDWRIDRSVAVAGSLPFELRTPDLDGTDDIGDWEQYGAYVYRILSYQELYEAAGGLAEPRRHVQIYNEFDGCCFSGAKGMAAAENYSSSTEGYLQGHVGFMVNAGESEHVFPVDLVIQELFGD